MMAIRIGCFPTSIIMEMGLLTHMNIHIILMAREGHIVIQPEMEM